MSSIRKIKLKNFRRFDAIEIEFDGDTNILIGDNESGKSSILLALDLVISGNRQKVESQGLESLFNMGAVKEFLASSKEVSELPKLEVELFLSEQNNPDTNGNVNSEGVACDGLRLICEARDDLSSEIEDLLKQDDPSFPFEYYSIHFLTFSGEAYTGYRRFIKHLYIDSSQISNEYATRDYIKNVYEKSVEPTEGHRHKNEYRRFKARFRDQVLNDVNSRLDNYQFAIRSDLKSSLQGDLTIQESGMPIEGRGKGKQCFIKTEFALKRATGGDGLDVVLLEEPENHLSHVNMQHLIARILNSTGKQLIIATHSNLISTRLDLRKAILMNSNSSKPASLSVLTEETAEFFMKAPDNNVLEFVLSRRVILVEGDAEFLLMSAFHEIIYGSPITAGEIHVISIGGTSFKRYLELANLLRIKVAVIRDNDGDYQANCVDRYSDCANDSSKIFADHDNARSTFEICMYGDNMEVCDEILSGARRTLSVEEYMLSDKVEAAFQLLTKKGNDLKVPQYIKDALEWIKS